MPDEMALRTLQNILQLVYLLLTSTQLYIVTIFQFGKKCELTLKLKRNNIIAIQNNPIKPSASFHALLYSPHP